MLNPLDIFKSNPAPPIEQPEKIPELIEKLDTVNESIGEKLNPLPEISEKLSSIPELIDKINVFDDIIEVLKPISKVCNAILHPAETLKVLWVGLLDASYWIVAIGGCICILLYVCGHKKPVRYVVSGTVIYTILHAINGVIA